MKLKKRTRADKRKSLEVERWMEGYITGQRKMAAAILGMGMENIGDWGYLLVKLDKIMKYGKREDMF